MHIIVNNGRKSAILNFIKLKFFRAYPYLKRHILFYSNIAIWLGYPDINNFRVNYEFDQVEIFQGISLPSRYYHIKK